MASIMTIRLNKSPGSSWGFRLQGGKDFATPLCIQKVNLGSVAEQAGLHAGDAIVSINGSDALGLRHKEAQDAIVRAGNNFELVVQRGSQIWKPAVTALPEPKVLSDGVPVATKTSLAANQKTYRPIGSGHNTSASPYQLVNAQYNSPVNIYSEDSIAETLSAQAEVLGKGGVLGINFKKYAREEKIRTDSPTYKLLHGEEEERKPRPVSIHNVSDSVPFQRDVTQDHKATPPPQNYQSGQSTAGAPSSTLQPGDNICYSCQTLITGVFVRIKNKNLHADCFKCSTCGSSLKNVGYYNINDKLYCDIHAKQAARSNPPAPNLVPVTVQPGAVPPAGAMTAPQASKMKIPSAFQQGGPAFAPAPAPAPAPPQTEVQQSEPQELPEPLPAPVFEPVQIPLAVSEVSSLSHLSSQIIENEGVVLPPVLNGGSFASEEEGLQPPQEALESESKPVENGYVEDTQSANEHVAAEETLPPKPIEDTTENEVVTSVEIEEVPQAPVNDVIETKETDSKTDLNNTEPYSVEEHIEVENDKFVSFTQQEASQGTEIPSQEEPSPIKIEEIPQELSHSLLKESSQEIPQELTHETVQTHFQDNIQEFSETQTQNSITGLVPEQPPLKLQTSEAPGSSLIYNINNSVHPSEGAISSSISHFRSEESRVTESKFSSSVVQMSVGNDTATQRAPAPAPAPVKPFAPAPAPAPVAAPVKPASAPSYSTSANPQGFGAPAGDINVRAHIPKKGDVPAPMTFAPIAAPVSVPISNFGSNTMPKPIPPPGTGGKIGPGGPPARGVLQAPGHRSAPRRGRGVMNQASASRIPVCNACHRQIRGPFVSALGKTWCPDHFICATPTCKRNIIDMGFVEEKGLLYCENCYESFLAPICGKCDKRIKGDCLNAVGKQFHPECFCCAYCGKVFGSGAFYLEDGLPYCETDWNDLFTTKCVGCNFPIEAGDRWVEALNNNYHSQCFKCSVCKSNLEGKSFYAKNGRPFCKSHAGR